MLCLLAVLLNALVFCSVPLNAQTQLAVPATFSLQTERDALLTLHDPIRFRSGDDPRWSDPAFDDSAWQLIQADRSWKSAGFNDLHGLAWYRFVVILPEGNESYSMRLPAIRTAYELYLNGQLLHASGDMPPHAVMFVTVPEVISLPTRSAKTLHLALRVWQDPVWCSYKPGGPQGGILIGRSSLIEDRFVYERLARLWRNSDWFNLTALELFAGLTALALFLFGRTEREYLWFSVLALCFALGHALALWARLKAHPVHPLESLESICFTGYLAASLMFYRTLVAGKNTAAFRVTLLCCVLWFLNAQTPFLPKYPATLENVGELIFIVPIYVWILALLFQRARDKWPDAWLLAVPVTLLVGTAFYMQLVFTISTFGHPEVMGFYPILHGLFYADMKDVAEGFFLLTMLLILGNRFARTRRASDRAAAELDAARSVQRVLVPDSLPIVPGLGIASAYYPAQQVGGDFFQIIPLPSGDTLVVIGDVAGKGVAAALTVSLIVGTLRTLADYTEGPAEVLSNLNRYLSGRASGVTTCLVMQFSADCQSVRIANAGHLSPYIDAFEIATEANLPLSFVPDALYAESVYPLRMGQRLVLLTDGVPEAMHDRELFGFDRTCSLCFGLANDIANAARTFGQTDDITVLSIDVLQIARV